MSLLAHPSAPHVDCEGVHVGATLFKALRSKPDDVLMHQQRAKKHREAEELQLACEVATALLQVSPHTLKCERASEHIWEL